MVFHASVEPFRSCLHLKTLLQNSTEEDPGTWMDRKLCWLWFVISEGSSALAAEAPSHRNPGLDVWKCLVLAGFLSLSSPVPSMLCCEATSSFGLNCMQIGFTLWHCFAHFFRQAQRARWLQDGWKIFLKKVEWSLHSGDKLAFTALSGFFASALFTLWMPLTVKMKHGVRTRDHPQCWYWPGSRGL